MTDRTSGSLGNYGGRRFRPGPIRSYLARERQLELHPLGLRFEREVLGIKRKPSLARINRRFSRFSGHPAFGRDVFLFRVDRTF